LEELTDSIKRRIGNYSTAKELWVSLEQLCSKGDTKDNSDSAKKSSSHKILNIHHRRFSKLASHKLSIFFVPLVLVSYSIVYITKTLGLFESHKYKGSETNPSASLPSFLPILVFSSPTNPRSSTLT